MSTRSLYTVTRTLFLGAALALLSGLAPSPAHAQATRPRVGIIVSVRVNVTPREARALREALGDALHSVLGVAIATLPDRAGRSPESDLDQDCVAKPVCLSRLGQAMGVDELLILSLVRIGSSVQMNTVWTEVADGHPTSRPAIRLDDGADRRALLRRDASALLPHIDVRVDVRVDVHIAPRAEAENQREGAGQAGSSAGAISTDYRPLEPISAPTGRRITTGVWVSGGIATGLLVGGAVFGGLATREFDSLQERGCGALCPPDALARVSRRALTADILFGAALASSATALYLYWQSGRSSTTSTRPSVGIDVGAHSLGLSIRGRI